MTEQDRSTKLLGLFALAFLLFNFPIISLFSNQRLWGGLPALYWYVFVCWIALIGLTALIVKPRSAKNKP